MQEFTEFNSTRRTFLERTGLAAAACWYPSMKVAAESKSTPARDKRSARPDILIVGAGLGGCAAALAATRMGARVVMTEPTDWIGGQLTQQAVPPDEHRWIESFGSPASYRKLRDGIRDHYRFKRPLTPAAKDRKNLDPGDGVVSRLCHEPRVVLAVLDEMLAPTDCIQQHGELAKPPERSPLTVTPVATHQGRCATRRNISRISRIC